MKFTLWYKMSTTEVLSKWICAFLLEETTDNEGEIKESSCLKVEGQKNMFY